MFNMWQKKANTNINASRNIGVLGILARTYPSDAEAHESIEITSKEKSHEISMIFHDFFQTVNKEKRYADREKLSIFEKRRDNNEID